MNSKLLTTLVSAGALLAGTAAAQVSLGGGASTGARVGANLGGTNVASSLGADIHGGGAAGNNPAGGASDGSLNTNSSVNTDTGYNTGITGRSTTGTGPNTTPNTNNDRRIGTGTEAHTDTTGSASTKRWTHAAKAKGTLTTGAKARVRHGSRGIDAQSDSSTSGAASVTR